MYSDSEIDSVLKTYALNALYLTLVTNKEPQGLEGENNIAPNNASNLIDRISATYL